MKLYLAAFPLFWRSLLHHFLDWQCLLLQSAVGNGVLCQAALEKQSRLLSLFLYRAPESIIWFHPVITERRLTDIDHDDVTTEVHHLTAGDEGGVVVPGYLTCTRHEGNNRFRAVPSCMLNTMYGGTKSSLPSADRWTVGGMTRMTTERLQYTTIPYPFFFPASLFSH